VQRRQARAAVAGLPAYEAVPAHYPAAPQPTAVLYPDATVPLPAAREHRRFDWVLGIVLGIVLGLAVAAGFVFIGSEDTVDAPRIQGIDNPGETERLPGR
jgi:hypothetical protein